MILEVWENITDYLRLKTERRGISLHKVDEQRRKVKQYTIYPYKVLNNPFKSYFNVISLVNINRDEIISSVILYTMNNFNAKFIQNTTNQKKEQLN